MRIDPEMEGLLTTRILESGSVYFSSWPWYFSNFVW